VQQSGTVPVKKGFYVVNSFSLFLFFLMLEFNELHGFAVSVLEVNLEVEYPVSI
ncbi:MAG: hypothetical protein RIQ50_1245, partial [Bacteroidota bacterium]